MIAYIKGTLTEKELTPAAHAIIEAAGIGYELFIPLSTFDVLPPVDSACKLFVHDYVREDAHLLFGFATQSEKQLFLLLQNVSGVGPKLALSILSGMPVQLLKRAIVDGDVKLLSKISGVGKRTAERLVVDLKGKINPLEAAASDSSAAASDEMSLPQAFADAILGLTTLGHSQEAAVKAVRELALDPSTHNFSSGEIIRLVLAGNNR